MYVVCFISCKLGYADFLAGHATAEDLEARVAT